MFKTKKTYGIVAVMLALSLLLCSGCGSKKEPLEQVSTQIVPKTYSTATVDDDFIDNKVLVVMQPNVSHLEYGKKDFQEIKCKDVLTLTDDYYIEKSTVSYYKSGANKALILTLKEHSKQNVIDAVKKLEKRADVLLAEPAYEGTFAVSPRATEITEENETVKYVDRIYFPYYEDVDYIPDCVRIGIQPYADHAEYTVDDFAYVGCTEILEDSLIGETDRYLYLKVDAATKDEQYRIVNILAQRNDARYVVLDWIMGPEGALDAGVENYVNRRGYSTVPTLTQTQINNIISLPEAMALSNGTNTVTVGIIDTGIDITHPDLQGHVNTSLSRNFSAAYSSFDDDEGHGTAVAGVINAITNDAAGFDGTVQFVSLKVRHNGIHNSTRVNQAIQYATSAGIDVLVCSLEVLGDPDMAGYINQYPGVFVCAAGNDGHDIDFAQCMPASLASQCDNIIAVGASDGNDNIAQFYVYNPYAEQWDLAEESNTGNGSVLLFAPGSMMTVCHPQSLCSAECSSSNLNHISNGYHYGNGTSLSAPLVAGVVVLMLVEHPNLSAAELKEYIEDGVDDCGTNFDLYCISDGRLNAEHSLLLTNSHCNYTYINAIRHRKICSCGTNIEENHTYTTSGTTRTCIYCGYQVQLQSVDPEHEIE